MKYLEFFLFLPFFVLKATVFKMADSHFFAFRKIIVNAGGDERLITSNRPCQILAGNCSSISAILSSPFVVVFKICC